MKKISKRFLSLFMAVLMVLSCTVVASASYVEPANDNITAITKDDETCTYASNVLNGNEESGSFTITDGFKYVYLVYAANNIGFFNLYKNGRQVCMIALEGNSTGYRIPITDANSDILSGSYTFNIKPAGACAYQIVGSKIKI